MSPSVLALRLRLSPQARIAHDSGSSALTSLIPRDGSPTSFEAKRRGNWAGGA
jgi:hypothetical protein